MGTAILISLPYILWNQRLSRKLSDLYALFPKAPLETLLLIPDRMQFWKPFWSAQFILWNPIVFFSCFVYLILDQRRFFLYDQNSRFTGTLFLWAFVPLAVVSALWFNGSIEANWALIGAVPASILVLARFKFRGIMRSLLLLSNLMMGMVALFVFIQGKDIAPRIEAFAPNFAARLSKRSRLDEFRNWSGLHLLLHTTIGGDPAPIVIPDRQTLASLLFAEESSDKGVQFKGRLKTFPMQSGKGNFFQREARYLLDPKTKDRFWYFSKERPKELSGCRAFQSLERIPGEIYWLLECNAND